MAGKRIAVFTLLALVVFGFTVLSSTSTHAQSYKPFSGYTLTNNAADNASDSAERIGISVPDFNYEDGVMFSFSPADAYVATGSQLPIGEDTGGLAAEIKISMIGGPCSTGLSVYFPLENASTNIADELGTSDMSWILSTTAPPDVRGANPGDPPNGLKDYLDAYPYFLNVMLDPDAAGPLLPLQPRARYAGVNTVAGMWVIIQFLVFNPGQLELLKDQTYPAGDPDAVFGQMGPEKGYPTYIVLDNPREETAAPSSISDFCTSLVTSTSLKGQTTGGFVRAHNAAANTGILLTGTHLQRNYNQSERDADVDNYENDLDPCRWTTDPGWSPRQVGGAGTGDEDNDWLPDSCDPDITGDPGDADLIDCPSGGTLLQQRDCDDDAYDNANDNCPLVPNGTGAGEDNQLDSEPVGAPDLGPAADAIGDACDDSDDDGLEAGGGGTQGIGNCDDGIDNDADNKIDGNDPECQPYMDKGELATNPDPLSTDIWGLTPQQGTYWHAMPTAAVCVGEADTDGDGYCDSLEVLLGSPINDGSESDGSLSGGPNCANAIDDDGDGYVNDGCPLVGDWSETGAECLNAVSDDTAGANPNPDWPDSYETALGIKVNDGCPVIGVPESLIIDNNIQAGPDALPDPPQPAVPQSCTDGVDNDNDGKVDAADNSALGCDSTDASYDNDADDDGVGDATDNCPADANSSQTNTDVIVNPPGDALGDECDDDDDDDGFDDSLEWYLGTDPLADCPMVTSPETHDAWPLDINIDRNVTVVGDVLKYRGNVGCNVTLNWTCARLDINGDGQITVVGDVLKFRGNVGASCTYP